MKTSNFANNRIHDLKGISISRFPDKQHGGYGGVEFPPLMPSEKLLKMYKEGLSWQAYASDYKLQLECLDAEKTWDRLYEIAKSIGVHEPVLLCWESAKTLDTNPCHRRIVAEWFERRLGCIVPEWTKTEPQGSLFS
jgi:hypothetical protein